MKFRKLIPHLRKAIAVSAASALFIAPFSALEAADDPETFSIKDHYPGAAGVTAEQSKKSAPGKRSAPISGSGSFSHSISIQVPPGRLGMEPNLTLDYSSSDRKMGEAGVGWSLSLPRIQRPTRNGYPKLLSENGDPNALPGADPLHFVDQGFDGPDGELVENDSLPSDQRGPTGVTGVIYTPKREHAPVRYEYRAWNRQWIRHDPSGRKSYFGARPGGGPSAIIETAQGDYAWLIVRDEDAHGNHTDYFYHHLPATGAVRPAPILHRALWGGNARLGQPHLFEARVTVEPSTQRRIDLLRGGLELSERIARIEVGTLDLSDVYWSYELEYTPSGDTGLDLLHRVIRRAPGETDQTTTFTYSSNTGVSPRWSSPMDLPELWGLYSDTTYVGTSNNCPLGVPDHQVARDDAISPPRFRAAQKFIDFEGDGDLDTIYHPGGLAAASAKVRFERSLLKSGASWNQPSVTNGNVFEIPGTRELTNLNDLDGDLDIDVLAFPFEEVKLLPQHAPPERGGFGGVAGNAGGGGPPLPEELLCVPDSACQLCTSSAFWKHCGMVDPPPGGVPLEDVLGGLIDPADAYGFDEWVDPSQQWPWSQDPMFGYAQPNLYQDGPCASSMASDPDCILWGGSYSVVQDWDELWGDPTRTDLGPGHWSPYTYDDPAGVIAPEGFTPEDPGLGGETFPLLYCGCLTMCWDLSCKFRPEEIPPAPEYGVDDYLEGPQAWIALNQAQPGGPIGPKRVSFRHWPEGVIDRVSLEWCGAYAARSKIISTFSAPLLDLDADGLSDVVLTKYRISPIPSKIDAFVTTVPRAYIGIGEHFISDWQGPYRPGEEQVSQFTSSLIDALAGGNPDGCVEEFECERMALTDPYRYGTYAACSNIDLSCREQQYYPTGADFTSIFLDVNSDGLPDLISAHPPEASAGGLRRCIDGHRVLLNQGYRFETWTDPANKIIPDETWSSGLDSPATAPEPEALALLRNRNLPFCIGPTTEPEPPSISGSLVASIAGVPSSAMETVDLNADGRIDLVFAYLEPNGTLRNHVYLNTGSGFERPSPGFAPNFQSALPTFYSHTTLDMKLGGTGSKGEPAPSYYVAKWQDLQRLVDLDSDGLVDALFAGNCQQQQNGAMSCIEPSWRKNLGIVPDLLTRVSETSGAWTEVDYVAAGSEAAQISGIINSPKLPQGLIVVSEIRRAAGPSGSAFAVETITTEYESYHEDSTSTDSIGFAKVTYHFQNSLDGQPREILSVRQTFNVQAVVIGVPGAHPLRGTVRETLTWSGSDSIRETFTHRMAVLGSAAQIRPLGTVTEECTGGVCEETAEHLTEFDTLGYAARSTMGRSTNGVISTGPGERTMTETEFSHDRSLWILGRSGRETVTGYRETIDGTVEPWVVLQEIRRIFTGPNLTSETIIGAKPVGCALFGNETTSYTYFGTGQLRTLSIAARTVTFGYDADELHVSSRSVPVTTFLDGVAIGSTTLVETYETDRRTGSVARLTDVAGQSHETDYDSLGRELEMRGPGGELLQRIAYQDTYPVQTDATIFTAPGVSFVERSHLDGDGRVLATVVSGAATVARSHADYDAFGRMARSYQPRSASDLDDHEPLAGAPAATVTHDGFDRVLASRDYAGRLTTTSYTPSSAVQVNPRAFATRRLYDWRGELIGLERFDGPDPETSFAVLSNVYTRDGLGRLNRIEEGTGSIRRLERDGAGRIHKLELPHHPWTAIASFDLCYDDEGEIVSIATPGGRSVSVLRDEIARPIQIESSDSTGQVVRTISYDLTPDSRGRISRLSNDSGITTLSYDAYGRQNIASFAPSALVKDGVSYVADEYTADFDYEPQGQLRQVAFSSILSGAPLDLGIVRYQRDARGRPVTLSSDGVDGPLKLVSGGTYDPHDRLRAADFINGTFAEWSYDPLTEYLTEIEYVGGAQVVGRASYPSFDANGNIRRELRQRLGASGPYTEKNHTYDALDRLSSSRLELGGSIISDQIFGYSGSGNLTRAADQAYAYGSAEIVQAVTGVSDPDGYIRILTYDGDGWLRTDSFRDPKAEKETRRALVFDASGCLKQVDTRTTDLATGTLEHTLTQHVCGHDGTRVFRKTIDISTGQTSRVVSFGKLAEIRPDEGVFLTRLDINGTALVEEARDLQTGQRVPAESGFVFGDVRGSVLARTSFTGPATVIEREAEYDAWGATIETSGAPVPTHAFVGHEPDPSDGYYHFGRRVYDPTLRRWLSPDPLLFAAPELDTHLGRELNLYSYAGNNPVRNTDRTGLALDENTGELLHALAKTAANAVEAGASGDPGRALEILSNGTSNALSTFQANVEAGVKAGTPSVATAFVQALDAGIAAGRAMHRMQQGIEGAFSLIAGAEPGAVEPGDEPKELQAPEARGRGSNQFRGPDPKAAGAHTRFRGDDKGVTTYETYDHPEPGRGKRVDAVGPPHGGVATPHTVDTVKHVNPKDPSKSSFTESRPRPSTPDEVPRRRK